MFENRNNFSCLLCFQKTHLTETTSNSQNKPYVYLTSLPSNSLKTQKSINPRGGFLTDEELANSLRILDAEAGGHGHLLGADTIFLNLEARQIFRAPKKSVSG
jgi:hypothetical protein